MYKCEVNMNQNLGEQTYVTTLKNGLSVYICKKVGFEKKIAMFGTKYGSLMNEFTDITTGKRTKVPDGIAHFLEHKLFEKEGGNALDLFAERGISANAYTSFDQTVYYFETITKFEEGMEMLVKVVKEPYFTDENVAKEQGIIGQEIKMGNDEPSQTVFYNMLKAMYHKTPVKIDIAGTVESISKITKELLYKCYHTYYSPQNMFFVVVGDVDIENTLKILEDNIKIYEKGYDKNQSKTKIETFFDEEPSEIVQKEIEEKMDVFLPQMLIGYKLDVVKHEILLKRQIVADIVSDMYFSKQTQFFEKEYNKGYIDEPVELEYEGSNNYSSIIIEAGSLKIDKVKEDILEYVEKIKAEPVDEELFQLIKKKKIGHMEFFADNLNSSYRRIIDSIINETGVYSDCDILNLIQSSDIKEFLNLIDNNRRVISVIRPKN
ncbi:MAG: pitrilysin family protein [Clostridia bacterium]